MNALNGCIALQTCTWSNNLTPTANCRSRPMVTALTFEHRIFPISQRRRCADIATAHRALLERCVFKAQLNGQDIPASELPGEIVALIAERISKADPQADLKIDLRCPVCNANWQAIFDIESFSGVRLTPGHSAPCGKYICWRALTAGPSQKS